MKGPHDNFIHLTVLFWNRTTAIESLRCFKSFSHHISFLFFREKRWENIHIYIKNMYMICNMKLLDNERKTQFLKVYQTIIQVGRYISN